MPHKIYIDPEMNIKVFFFKEDDAWTLSLTTTKGIRYTTTIVIPADKAEQIITELDLKEYES